jgi:hypothetical protein
MRNIRTRAMKVTMAAAFGAAFIGSALAASPIDGIGNGTGDGGNSNAASTPDTPSTSGLTGGLANVEKPTLSGSGVSYVMRHHDGNLHCKGVKGGSSLPGTGGHLQHPTQCKDNSVAHGKAEVAGLKL